MQQALVKVRDQYEARLVDNIVSGRRASERVAAALETQVVENRIGFSRVVASQEPLRVGNLGLIMTQVGETIGALLSVVDGRLADIAYQQRLSNDKLLAILQTLQAPLDTRAKELRRRAEDAFRHGWMDDAREDFLESRRLNRYDFTVHHALGTIAYVHSSDFEEARGEFKLAARYAGPKSSLDAAYALVAWATVEERLGDLTEAFRLSAEAVEVGQGTCPEAYYARGRYRLAGGGDRAAAVSDLEVAFWGNPGLAIAAMGDGVLNSSSARSDLDSALKAFRSGLARRMASRRADLEAFRRHVVDGSPKGTQQVFKAVILRIDDVAAQIRILEARDSISDYMEGIRTIAHAMADSREAAIAAACAAADRLKADASRRRVSAEAALARKRAQAQTHSASVANKAYWTTGIGVAAVCAFTAFLYGSHTYGTDVNKLGIVFTLTVVFVVALWPGLFLGSLVKDRIEHGSHSQLSGHDDPGLRAAALESRARQLTDFASMLQREKPD